MEESSVCAEVLDTSKEGAMYPGSLPGEVSSAKSRLIRCLSSAHGGPRGQPGNDHSYITLHPVTHATSTQQGVCCLPHKRPLITSKCGTLPSVLVLHQSEPPSRG